MANFIIKPGRAIGLHGRMFYSGDEDALADNEGEGEAAEEEEPPGIEIPADEVLLGVVVDVDRKAAMARVAFTPELDAEVHLADVDWARKPAPRQRPRPVRRITDIFSRGAAMTSFIWPRMWRRASLAWARTPRLVLTPHYGPQRRWAA